VNSFEYLASEGFYDGVTCHRLALGFVLQCGDPTGAGIGGPGYRFDDELDGSETYPYGVLAMANSGPNTQGSQFFIVIGHDVQLPPNYTVFGSVDAESMNRIETGIVAHGIDGPAGAREGYPNQGADILHVSVS
jgi:peptidyl-prolyl cis-trans isomerase B (cyclophilin B)